MTYDQTETNMRLKDVLARHAYRFAGLSMQADLLIQRLSAAVGFDNDAPVQHLTSYRSYSKAVLSLG